MFNNHTVLRFPLKDKIDSLYDDIGVTYTLEELKPEIKRYLIDKIK